ncbi:MAG: hypothetical protein JWO05_1465 [Gemmatimonadetes bacterium]|nr:hypothetical protein [Gemmatimonadota bacterium]
MAYSILLLLAALHAPDSLMAKGVSHALAIHRAAQLDSVSYAIDLDVTRHDTASGHVRIGFVRRGGGDVILDWRGLALSNARVKGASAPAITTNGSHIRIPAAALQDGANVVDLDFSAAIAPAGASVIRYHDSTDGADYLYTLLVPSDAHALFPCFDQPDLKARVTLSLTTPLGWKALANGRLARADSTPLTVHHRFTETEPISTYLVAFAAGPWATETRVIDGRGITMWVRASRAKEAEADSLIGMNGRALTWLEEYTAHRYAFGKYDFLLAPAFPFGGMEHPGAVFYNEDRFIFREKPTTSQLLGREATIFHEVSHQWFGDLVTMRWFDDLWLKEGFATYMAAVMQSQIDPAANAWKTFFLGNKPVAYATDASRGTTPVWQELANLDQAKSNYGPIVYQKAPSILKQLNYLVGDTAFRDGLRAYVKAHAYGNATWRDLLSAVGRAGHQDLTAWGRQYILRAGMPVVTQSVVRTAQGWRLELTQQPAQSLSGAEAWPIRFDIGVPSGDSTYSIPVYMTERTKSLSFTSDYPALVFPNLGDKAYALVHLDDASVRWIERNVSSVRDPLLRPMLWGAMWDLVRDARLPPARFVRAAIAQLPRERDDQVAPFVIARLRRAVDAYLCDGDAVAVRPALERMLLAGAADSSRAYSVRKAHLDAYIGAARSPAAIARLDAWLDSSSAAGIPLRPPTRWSLVSTLLSRRASGAEARLAGETRRDSTSEGKRLAFVAGAARPDSATKAAYWARWFNDPSLNEDWVTASLGAFNDVDAGALTRRYLTPALDTLPWIQRNRRIFFLGSWIGAFMSGHRDAASLAQVNDFLAKHPALPKDLRDKILQSSDELERAVRIRKNCR